MQRPQTARRPGRPLGTPNPKGGRKPAAPSDLPTTVFVARCCLFPAARYPGHAALYRAMQVGPATFARRLRGQGDFTPAQLAAAAALLDAAAPWVHRPPPDTLPTREDVA